MNSPRHPALSQLGRQDTMGGQTHLEHRIDGFEHVCHTLERSSPSIPSLPRRATGRNLAVEAVQQQREQGLQIEIPARKSSRLKSTMA